MEKHIHEWVCREYKVISPIDAAIVEVQFEYRCTGCGGEKIELIKGSYAERQVQEVMNPGV